MVEIEKFSEPAPPFFAMQMDTRPKKQLQLETATDIDPALLEPSKEDFNTTLDRMLKTANQADPAYTKAQETASKRLNQQAEIRAIRQIQGIYEGAGGFLPADLLGKIEQTQTKFNFEDKSNPSYVFYPDKLKLDDKKSGELENEIFDSGFLNDLQSMPGEGNTMPHNATLLSGIGSNPFKKKDLNYSTFLSDPLYRDLHTGSQSPRSILSKLDPQFWEAMNKQVQAIQNESKGGSAALGVDNAKDPFSDNTQIDTFDIKSNYHSLILSQKWTDWDNSKVFSFVNRAWESRSRVENSLRALLGSASDMPDEESDATDGTVSTQTADQKKASNDAKLANAKAHLDEWFKKVGSRLSEVMLLPFGMLSSVAPAMATMMDWGKWGADDAATLQSKSGFREKMISGFLSQAKDNYILSRFKGSTPLTKNNFLFDNQESTNALWNTLVEKQYLTSSGQVGPKFDAKDPDFNLGLGLDTGTESRVRTILREAAIGNFSLEVQDKTTVNGRKKIDFQLTGSDGKSRSLTEIVDLINSGNSAFEKIQNAHLAYDYFMKIHSALTGITSSSTSSDGAVSLTPSGTLVQANVAADGQWKEWQVTGSSEDPNALSNGEWVSKNGPISIKFNSAAEAEKFKDNIRMLLAVLEPVVGTFSPDDTTGATKAVSFLTDNSNGLDQVSSVKEGQAGYRMSLDKPFSKSFFDSDSWKQISTQINRSAMFQMQKKLFERMMGNQFLRADHTKKVEDYEQRKQDYEEGEYQRLETEAIQERDRQESELRQEIARKEEEKASKEADARRQQERRAQELAQEEG